MTSHSECAAECWEPCFAWLPLRALDGRLVWLSKVERRWNIDLNPWAYYEYSGTDGGWEYRRKRNG